MDKTVDSVEDILHFCFKNEILGVVTGNHLGMGWYSTRFKPTGAFTMLSVFADDLRTAHKTLQRPELFDRLEELKKQYKDLMKPEYWTLADANGKDIYTLSTIPVFHEHEEYVSASWQGEFIDTE